MTSARVCRAIRSSVSNGLIIAARRGELPGVQLDRPAWRVPLLVVRAKKSSPAARGSSSIAVTAGASLGR